MDKVWRAYHGSEAEKTAFLAYLRAHVEAGHLDPSAWDDLICDQTNAVHTGLFPQSPDEYEALFGIPYTIGCLEDMIYMGLWPDHAGWDRTHERARDWPLRLMSAIEPGADLSQIGWQFLRELFGRYPGMEDPAVVPFVQRCWALLDKTGSGLDADDYVEARAIQDEIELTSPHLAQNHRAVLRAVKEVADTLERAAGIEWDGLLAYGNFARAIGGTILSLALIIYDARNRLDIHARVADRLVELIATASRD